MPDDADALAAKAAEAAHDCDVVAELAIAGARNEIGVEGANTVKAMGTLRMASDLGLLPRREFGVEIFEHLRRPGFEAGNLLADGGCTVAGLERAQFCHLGLEFSHGLFEVEIAAHRAAL